MRDLRAEAACRFRRPAARRVRRGFSLIEVMLVTTLTAFLSMLIAGLCANFGRSVSDMVVQARLLSSAQMALETLRRDLAGHLPETQSGTKFDGMVVGKLVTSDDRLLICFDGEPTNEAADWWPPDEIVMYNLQGDQLVRTNLTGGGQFVVADHVSSFEPEEGVSGVSIALTFSLGDFTRSYTFVSEDP